MPLEIHKPKSVIFCYRLDIRKAPFGLLIKKFDMLGEHITGDEYVPLNFSFEFFLCSQIFAKSNRFS